MNEKIITEKRKLNILQVASHSSIRRGGAIQLTLLVDGLKKLGHNVICIFNLPKGKEKIKGEEDIKYFNKNIGRAECVDQSCRLCTLYKLKKIVQKNNIDIIHVHRDAALNFAYASGIFTKNIPIVAQRGTDYSPKNFSLTKLALKSNRIKRIIAVSNAVKQSLIQNGIDESKIEVVYGGVDLNRFNSDISGSDIRQEFGIDENRFVFGNIASFAPKKGYDIFFKACGKVINSINNAIFLVAGDGNFNKFQPLIEQLGIKDKVIYAGFRRDIEKLISAMNVVICSSTKGEGLTGAIREALVMKKPVISTDVAGNKEFIIPEKTGYLIPPFNVDALAQAMIESANNYQHSLNLAENGYNFIKDLVDNNKRIEKIEKIYLEILSR